MDPWNRVVELLDDQHGVVAIAQLTELGISARRRRTWVESGRLSHAAPGVVRLTGSPVTWRQRLHAGTLSLGPRSWVSHEAASQLHGFDRTPPDRVEFLVLRPQRGSRLEEQVRSTRRWSSVDEVVVDGLRVTSATRTILDLANVRAHPDRISAAIDTAVRLELSSPYAIQARLDRIRSRGRAGVKQIEHLLLDSGGHTMLERRFLKLLREWDFPRPATQVVIRRPDGHFVARVDFLFADHAVVVEVSGKVGHSSPDERARDAQRRNELQHEGLRVLEFTWEDVTQREMAVVTTMRRALRSSA